VYGNDMKPAIASGTNPGEFQKAAGASGIVKTAMLIKKDRPPVAIVAATASGSAQAIARKFNL